MDPRNDASEKDMSFEVGQLVFSCFPSPPMFFQVVPSPPKPRYLVVANANKFAAF